MTYELHEMDCRLALSMLMDADSIDAIVTDPPYGLSKEPDVEEVLRHWLNGDDYEHGSNGFMGRSWDSFVPGPAVWREAYRVLKPGGHLVAFFGTRTYDLGVMALRMAGFEIRDQLAWVFGSGFPKSHDVSKGIDKALGAERATKRVKPRPETSGTMSGSMETRPFDPRSRELGYHELPGDEPATPEAAEWQGWGTALKPAYEPIVLCRKPLSEPTVAANVLRWGTGAINIDGCRVGDTVETWPKSRSYAPGQMQPGGQGATMATGDAPAGRWPANLCHDGSPEVLAEFPVTTSGKMKAGTQRAAQDEPGSVCYRTFGGPATDTDTPGDSGSAARFFKSAELGDEDWLAQNLPHVLANIADKHLSLRSLFDAFALGLAVNSDHRAEMRLNDCPALSIPATLNESKRIGEMLIGLMPLIESAFSQESPPTKLSLSLNLARFVADLTPTGITLTMTDLLISSGFVDPITFNITPTSLDRGARDCGPSMARFKYCAKASKSDRNEGLDDLPAGPSAASQFRPNHAEGAANGEDGNPYGRWSPVKNTHATVKPSALMQWLVRLVTPPGGTVLDPFTGSGTTGVACGREGFNFIGCEMTPEYIPIASRRIAHAYKNRKA